MKREVVRLSEEDIRNALYDESEQYLFIDEEQTDYDSEKGSAELEVIFKRVSDDKYFKYIYGKWPAGRTDYRDCTLTEVFPKKTITNTYE